MNEQQQQEVAEQLADVPGQEFLFDNPPAWADQWKSMPRYDHDDLESWKSIRVHFKDRRALNEFADLIGQRLSDRTRAIWFPEAEIGSFAGKKFLAKNPQNPIYPVYIISKGRWESRMTARSLDEIGVPYHIVVEPQEFGQYAAVIDPSKILQLPFSNLGQGSIPARNWVWEHAKTSGAARHWILDDNIRGFFYYQNNLKTPVGDGTIFRIIERFVDRYENVAMAGMHYFMFVSRKSATIPPFTLNTRVYSCILLRNNLPFRWRGRYNEDTDLSLRILKDGLCTVLFCAFLCGKSTTMQMKGGNTDELYKGDGRRKMAESLFQQHPDVTKIVRKWGRWQHHVDYSSFRKNKLILKDGASIDGLDDFGMVLHQLDNNETPSLPA